MSSLPIRRYPLAVLGALVLLLAVAAAVLAPNLPLADPDIVDTPNRLRPPPPRAAARARRAPPAGSGGWAGYS
jgi:hypothetical protein